MSIYKKKSIKHERTSNEAYLYQNCEIRLVQKRSWRLTHLFFFFPFIFSTRFIDVFKDRFFKGKISRFEISLQTSNICKPVPALEGFLDVFAYFQPLLDSFSPLPLSFPPSLSLHSHTQTQTNTAVTVAYYLGQVRACRWGLLNAGATVHQCLRNRGTCCDHRWRPAIYTHMHRPARTS